MPDRTPDLLDVIDLARRLSNLLRLGTIEQIDHPAARVRVRSGDIVTARLPWFTWRAGATSTWSAPTVGEQVLILAPSGDLAGAVVLPALYTDAHPAPSSSPTQHVTRYPDGATISYDHATGQADISGATLVTVQATGAVVIDAPVTTVTGALTVQGLLTYQSGLAGTGGGAGTTITGNITQTGGQITSNGIHLATHTHSGVRAGTDHTGAPE